MDVQGGFSQVGRVGVRGFLGELGERVRRRPEPRFGIGLAGVGMLMILVGIVAWAGDVAADSATNRADPDTTLGVLESLVIIGVGIALLVRYRYGPLATAGVVASGLGVPVFLSFLTFDPSISEDSAVFLLLPVNLDVLALGSVAAWLVAFARLPYARGRTFYLAASSAFLWLYAAEKVEEGAAGYLLTLPVSQFYITFGNEFGDEVVRGPEATNIGIVSLLFGLGYYALALWLDRRGNRGSATPFTTVGFVATVIGVIHLAGDLEAAGSGLVLIATGAVLAVYGANQGRRFTTWAWCLGIGLGVLLIVGDFTEHTVAGFGIAAIVLGAGVIALAHLLTLRLVEPDEMWPGPSGLAVSRLTATPPTLPPPPPPPPPPGTWPTASPGPAPTTQPPTQPLEVQPPGIQDWQPPPPPPPKGPQQF